MLRHLHIENYALIKSLDISFDDGFTVITGETGAGKSILLGALSLILGTRADTTVLFDNNKKCIIEGEFLIQNLSLLSFFENYNLDYNDITLLRREINESGKSRAFINDTPVTLPILRELAVKLVDIHSQHQSLLLHNISFRVNVLDQSAQNIPLLKTYKSILSKFKKAESEFLLLKDELGKREKEKDYLEYLNHELKEANLKEGEQQEAEQQLLSLSHAELIQANVYQAVFTLSEHENSVLQQLREIKNRCCQVISYQPLLQNINDRLEEILANLQDISFELSKIQDDTTSNPRELEILEKRLDHLYFLQQKHQVKTVEELIDKERELTEKLEEIEKIREKIGLLEVKKELLYKEAFNKATAISDARFSVVKQLEEEINEKLRLLGMRDASFKINIIRKESLSESGIDDVSFYFSANKGVDPEEIEKVASGGELSRLMLAIKSIIAESSFLPTIVFDEIDTGISGETAWKVASMMQLISSKRQLLVITHLPQIAAKGKLHYYVYKENVENNTFSHIKRLEGDDRVVEIAKMIAGENITPSAKEAAKELLR